jgi:hypothetical protein
MLTECPYKKDLGKELLSGHHLSVLIAKWNQISSEFLADDTSRSQQLTLYFWMRAIVVGGAM